MFLLSAAVVKTQLQKQFLQTSHYASKFVKDHRYGNFEIFTDRSVNWANFLLRNIPSAGGAYWLDNNLGTCGTYSQPDLERTLELPRILDCCLELGGVRVE